MKWTIMQIEENVIHRGRRPRSERPRGIALDKMFPLLMPEYRGYPVWNCACTVKRHFLSEGSRVSRKQWIATELTENEHA